MSIKLLKLLPYSLLIILAAFTSFEDFVLKFLPAPDFVFFYSRFLSELAIYAVFIFFISIKLIRRVPLARTPLDLPIFLFLSAALTSILINHSPLFGSLVNLRPWFRYFILFYLVVNTRINFNQANRIIRIVVWAGIVQVAIGILQYLSRGKLDSFLLPRATDTEIGGVAKSNLLLKAGREIGSIYGAVGDTVIYGVFTLLVLVLIISKLYILNQAKENNDAERRFNKKKVYWLRLTIPFFFMAISLSYVRACVFAIIILLTMHSLRIFGRVRTTVALLIIILLSSIILVAIPPHYSGNARLEEQSILANIAGVFTSDYTQQLKNQRLGALMGTAPTVIFNKPFLGYGADQVSAIASLNASKISFLTKVWTTEGFKDVYWVAILTFYGLAGLISLIWMFWRLYYSAQAIYKLANQSLTKEIALSVNYLVIITSFLLFFNRTIEFRVYGFYFWLLVGLMFKLYFQDRTEVWEPQEEE